MKKSNIIFESEGIVNGDMQWITLCNTIIEYMWDLENGLPTKNNDEEITRKDIEEYLSIKNKSNIIPEWIYNFTICIKPIDYKVNGEFLKREATLENNKLIFQINLKDRNNKNLMFDTLIHEFRHAYDRYIFLSKNLKLSRQLKDNYRIYSMAQRGFAQQEKPVSIIKNFTKDYIEINDKVFQDPTTLSAYILQSFYYINQGEIKSFLQEFYSSISKILENNKNQLIKDIQECRSFNGDFNSLPDEQKLKGNLLKNICVTPYDSSYYRLYKAFDIFANKLQYVNIDIANDTFKLISKEVKTFLNIPITNKLTLDDSETQEVLNKLSQKEKKIFDFVCLKMNKIFARALIQFEEDNI